MRWALWPEPPVVLRGILGQLSIALINTNPFLTMPFQSSVGRFGFIGRVAGLTSIILQPTGSNISAYVVKYNTNGSIQWAARLGDSSGGTCRGYSTATDSTGNVYVTGVYNFQITIYNASGTSFGTLANNGSTNDVFIIKYNTNGAVQWATRIAGGGGDIGYSIAVDSSANVYVTGYYDSAPATVYSVGDVVFRTLGGGSGDVFIVKYNTSGTAQWSAILSSSAAADYGYGIQVDSSGNVYVTGYAGATLTIFNANGSGTFGTLSQIGSNFAFIVKYNTSGTCQWAARIVGTGGSGNIYGQALTVDTSGNVYLTGYYTGTVNIYSGGGVLFGTTLANSSADLYYDTYVIKYDTSGNVSWATRITGTSGNKFGYGIGVDTSGNVYAVGTYARGSITIYNVGGGTFGTLTNAGFNDAFIIKYNSTGTVQWATRIVGTSDEGALGIAVDTSANIYITGYYFSNPATIYNVGGTTFGTLTNIGSRDAYVVKYNTGGTAQWSSRIGSTNNDSGSGISVDSNGNVYATGDYAAALTLYTAGA